MKLPAFDYDRPGNLAEAVAILAADEGARPMSGGQSLIPVLAFRLAEPTRLVDLRGIAEMKGIEIDGGGVRLGALVRWRDIEDDARLLTAHPLLAEAISHVAHYQIRNRGTVGGSLAHADPAAEMPGIAVACDAVLTVAGAAGTRTVAAGDFFLGPLATALEPGEILVEVRLPAWPAGRRWGFREFARRRGDFALAGIALFFDEADGRARNVHIGVIGTGDRPQRLGAAEAVLEGNAVTPETIRAVGAAVSAAVDMHDDVHASAAYREALAGALAERALCAASGIPESEIERT
jgi:carbon-monoxide dehydrogenase medium subunit